MKKQVFTSSLMFAALLLANESKAQCYASEVVSYNPGITNDLITPIAPTRTNPSKALGQPSDSDAQTNEANNNFVSLGFGGEITLKFEHPVANGEGDDIYVVETTFGQDCRRYPEKVKAYASQDNCNWVYLGEGCQNAIFDLKHLSWAQYIRLVDVSPIDYPFAPGIADGYDLDGIVCLNGPAESAEPDNFIANAASEAYDYEPGTMKNGQPVPVARRNKNNAVGLPQGTDVINFVSLGFGGRLSLRFDYVVTDKPGADLKIVETSYGNPSCSKYPETVRVEISLDNSHWYFVPGEFCLDQEIDIAGAGINEFHYLRLTDASPMSSSRFNNTTDGYDVDGVVVLQPNCSMAAPRMADIIDVTDVADEVSEVSVYPNPFENNVTLQLATSDLDESFEISLTNSIGQVLLNKAIDAAAKNITYQTLNTSHLPAGIYFVNVRSASNSEIIKVVKR